MDKKDNSSALGLLYFNKEELLKIFPLGDLKYIYKVYVDAKAEVSNMSENSLATLLDNKVPRVIGGTTYCNVGDLATDLEGNLVRIIKIDYIDDRFGPMVLVYDVHKRVKYANTSPLIVIPEFIFADSISKDTKTKLFNAAKGNNYLLLKNVAYVLGNFYVFNENLARTILNKGHFTYIHTIQPSKNQEEE